jgi:hypothetical protein
VIQNTRKRLLELATARVMQDWLERWPMPDEKLSVLVNLLDETNG